VYTPQETLNDAKGYEAAWVDAEGENLVGFYPVVHSRPGQQLGVQAK
jgi:hypothetical protein